MEAATDRLSEDARVILESMEPGRLYGPPALRAFLPDESIERVRQIMHELWIGRQDGTVTLEEVKGTFHAYLEAFERIVGVRPGSLQFLDDQTIEMWFG